MKCHANSAGSSSSPENGCRSLARSRGVAMLLVLIIVAMVTVLGTAFLAAQSTTTGITRNLEDQAVARQIAESGLTLIQDQILANPDWRTSRAQGVWVNNQTLGPGTFTVEITDEDGDPSDDPQDPFVLTVKGAYGDATHVVRAHVNPFISDNTQGLSVSYFGSSTALSQLSDVAWGSTPDYEGKVANVNRASESTSVRAYASGPTTNWGSKYEGYIEIPSSGLWTFYTESDEGSDLSINGSRVVNNDGIHTWRSASGSVSLDQGRYSFETRLFEHTGDHGVVAYWQGPGVDKEVIPESAFFRSSSEDSEATPDSASISVAVAGTIEMSGQTKIDAYDSTKGVYGATAKITDGVYVSTNGVGKINLLFLNLFVVTMKDSAKIEGKLMIDRNLAILDVLILGNSQVTKGIKKLQTDISIPTATAPGGAPNTSGSATKMGGTFTIASDTRFTKVKLRGSSVTNISGDVTVWCDGDFEMDGTAVLNVPQGSSLNLYIGGSLLIKDSAKLNDASNGTSRVNIYMYKTSGNEIKLEDDARISAKIIGKETTLEMKSNAVMYGTFSGSELDMTGSSMFHADVKGAEVPEDTTTAYIFAWDEGL